jgi:hypothetical protein
MRSSRRKSNVILIDLGNDGKFKICGKDKLSMKDRIELSILSEALKKQCSPKETISLHSDESSDDSEDEKNFDCGGDSHSLKSDIEWYIPRRDD